MVAFQENIICGRLLQEIHDQISKINMGEVKIEFQENNIRGRVFVQNLSSRKKLLTKSSANNMWQSNLSFKKTITACVFCADRRSLWGYFSMSVISK